MISISVVIPAWNAARYIGDAVDSVLSQSAVPQEIIVVDDGSTDDTTECVRRFGSRVTLIAQSNAGAAAARNRGITEAKGAAIALLDADDLMAPRRLELQGALLASDPQCAVVLGQQLAFRSKQELLALKSDAPDPAAIRPGYVPSVAMIRVGAFAVVGVFDPALRLGDFLEWITRARLRDVSTRQVEQIVAYRRLHAGSLSQSAGAHYANLVHSLRKKPGRTT